jgi:hypothetical protein
LAAKLRKHYVAFTALAAFHFVFFFPVLFMGRVVSPNDVFFYYEPWSLYRPASMVRVQNALMNDPATGYLPMIALVRSGLAAFNWNPYVGSGIPGFGSAAAASLTPLILLPTLLTPLPWVYTAIILLKINVAFLFGYAWLREERLGKAGAAIGAIVIAGAGIYSVRWLWQMTNATALYPALLWLMARAFNGKRTSIALTAMIALSYALAGFPSAQAYGAYLCVAYGLYRLIAARHARRSTGPLIRAAVGVVLALLIALPAIVPFVQLIRRSGYLPMRSAAAAVHYPLSHWKSFIDPQRLGNHALKNWRGDRALGPLNNDYEAAIYVGTATLALAAIALFARRRRGKWFWLLTSAVVLGCMFGVPYVANAISSLPGFKYTALSRVALLLPIPAGFLAAAGMRLIRLRVAAVMLALVVGGDLALYAGKFHPYLAPEDAVVPATPVVEFLRGAAQQPFRYAGFLTYLWPNSAEMYGIQDIASHFSSEADYRRILQRIDPTSWSGTSTVIQFNSIRFNFSDPLLSMLGVRYLLEHRKIDIIKWTIFANTVPAGKDLGAFAIASGAVAQRTIRIAPDPFWAIEIPARVDEINRASPRLRVELWRGATRLSVRDFTPSDIGAMNKIYVPVHGVARSGDDVTLRITPRGMRVVLPRSAAPAGESPFYYARVAIPVIFDRETPDARIFRNLAALPRFWPVKKLRKLNGNEFLAARDIDFAEEAVITDGPVFPPPSLSQDASVRLLNYAPAEQRIATNAAVPLFLASSEKLTPELRVTIDGRPVRPVQINMLFAGVNVPAGRHEVVFQRRIGRGWWPVSLLALATLIVIGVREGLRPV